jgi:soluble lytic murein transglycosylase
MRLMRFSNTFFIVLIFALNIFAQDFSEAHRKVLQSIESRDYQTAVLELENLKKADKKIFELNNFDYLLARIAEKKGDFALAAANYQTVVNRNSILKEYALWHLSQIARSSGNLLLERASLQEILTFAPESLLSEAVKIRLARSFFESKNYDTAIQLLNGQQTFISSQKLSTAPEKNPKYRENLVFLGEAYLQNQKINEAREIFSKLINNLPNPAQPDDFALAGARGLDRLDAGENFGKTAPELNDNLHYQRALIYQFNRDFTDARLHFRAIVEKFPASTFFPDALYQIGRGYAQSGDYSEAINWFERVIEKLPDSQMAKDSLNQAASAYSRVNKPKEAVSRYQKIIEKFPNDERIERAYLNIADVLRDSGEDSEALIWTAKTQEVFKGKLPEAIALFSQLRIHISQNDWQKSLADAEKLLTFADLGGTRVPGGTNKAEITFLKGFILENLQRYAEAINVYLSIPDGRNEYYGWRATERLQMLANDEKTKSIVDKAKANWSEDLLSSVPESQKNAAQKIIRLNSDTEFRGKLLETLKSSYSKLPEYQKIPSFKLLPFGRKEILREKRENLTNSHQNLADELLFLGLYDEATPELEIAQGANNSSNDYKYTLAVFYKRGEMANRAVAFIEPLWRNVPADFQVELMPREQVKLLYPAPYVDSLLKFAPPRLVDPRFVLSIMRQESRYRADVKSVAAARGLMQFISTTSNQIAKELGKENFKQDELYNPPTAILFGSQYLANIYKMFPAQHAAVAASYNGGEDNMKRWLARSKSDAPDRYVPEIIFSQSKDYAYKVMANFRVYLIFYDEKLKSR